MGMVHLVVATGVLFCLFNAAAEAGDGVRRLGVDFARDNGTIRALHGINGGPYAESFNLDLTAYHKALAIPSMRVHTPNAPATDSASVHRIFRDFSADADDPANYDFEKTDAYLGAIVRAGAQPVYNLANWGNKYRLLDRQPAQAQPVEDYEKYARICVNIIRHYNDGWADGHRWKIRYWEVWNEPNAPKSWGGSETDYFEFYEVVSRAIKEYDPQLMVGGPADYAVTGFSDRFLAEVARRGLPLDFYSFHCYHEDPAEIVRRAERAAALLERHGLADAELHVNEWAPKPAAQSLAQVKADPKLSRQFFERVRGPEGAAFDAAVLCYLQDSPVDVANFYSGDTLKWSFIDRYGAPMTTYFAFKAFAQMLETPRRVAATGQDLSRGVAILAGLDEKRSRAQLLIANHRDQASTYRVELKHLPWSGPTRYEILAVDAAHELELVERGQLPADAPTLTAQAAAPSVWLIQLSPASAE